MESVSLTILMPVFDELATVEEAIDDALSAELPVDRRELIVVDDGSKDGNTGAARAPPVAGGRDRRLPRHEPRQGRSHPDGLAVRDRRVLGDSRADLEYRRPTLRSSWRPSSPARRTWSSAREPGRTHAYSFWYVIGNRVVTLAANVLYNCYISDVMTCHKAMRTELFRSLRLRERGFAIEPEIAARVLRAGERIYEVPIRYRARTREQGKKLTALDGLRVLGTLVRCRVT